MLAGESGGGGGGVDGGDCAKVNFMPYAIRSWSG